MIDRFMHIRRAEEGTTAVEMAVVIMAVLFLILGSIEFALAYWTMHTLQLAVQEAGRWVMVNNTDPNITTDAESQMTTYYLPGAQVCISPSPGQYCVNAIQSANNNTVTLTAYYGFDVGITGSFTLTGETTVPLD